MNDVELLSSPDTAPSDAPAEAPPTPFTTPDAAPPTEASPADTAAAPPAPTDAAAPAAEEDEFVTQPEAVVEDPLTVKALNEKLAKSPELQAAFAKDPGLRNLMYATARQAQQVAQFKEIFQTPALAKTAMDLAQRHIDFESSFQTEPAKALDALFELTAQRDAQGNVLYDQPNQAYVAFATGYREASLWPYLAAKAQESGNEDWRDAVAIVAHQMLGDKINIASPFAQAQQQPQAPKHDAETEARLARLDELERGQQATTEAQAQQFHEGVRSGIHESVGKAARSYLDNLLKAKPSVVLTDFIKDVVIDKAVQEVYTLAKDDVSYKNHINFLARSSRKDDEGKAKLVAEATKYARERLPKLIAKHISEASKGIVATQQQRLEKQSTQAQRPEVQSTAGVPSPSRQDSAALVREFMTKNKRRPTDRELLDL